MIVHDEWKFLGNEYNFNSFYMLRFENLYWIKGTFSQTHFISLLK